MAKTQSNEFKEKKLKKISPLEAPVESSLGPFLILNGFKLVRFSDDDQSALKWGPLLT